MSTIMFLTVLVAAALAAPLAQPQGQVIGQSTIWQPAAGTKTTCNKSSDKIIGFYVGPQLETVVNNACAAMLPPCAYRDRLPSDTFCIQTIDWPLDGPKSSTEDANVENNEGNKISGWKVKFTVTPAKQPQDSAGVFWTVQDCYGYFAYMLQEWEPKGCHRKEGFGIGSITVGGDSSLKGSVLEVSIVPAE